MHPRLTILSRFAPPEATLGELARGGARRAGLSPRRVTATAPALLADAGISATHLGAAGYGGLFDLEVYPEPDVPAVETIARAIDHGGALLTRLGI